MNWRIAKAKQSFSKLISATQDEPQLIYNRDRLVAAVIEAGTFEEFQDWRKHHRRPSVADGALKVRQACDQEDYVFEQPSRESRPNPFTDALDDLSR